VLWFVRRGSLSVSHQGGCSIARAGEFAITRSMTPFSMECQTDDESVHEVFHVVVPTHVFRRMVPHDVSTGFSVPAQAREFRIAERILIDVFEDSDELAEHTEQLLVESALAVLADALHDCNDSARVRQSLSDMRLQDVLRFIEIHLSDPKLSTRMVASSCGISPRYLSYLLKQSGTSFSALVWDQRLKVARGWLSSSKPADMSIAEIAFRVGFKSPAHFSRMFKRVFSKGPREYRAALQTDVTNRPADLFAGGSTNTLQ
jgi:AraC family transcriptional regulator, positive regulator of tynA and feaB